MSDLSTCTMKKVSLIIPIYNRIAITKDGLTALFENFLRLEKSLQNAYSVIVVDDGSTDGSSEMIKEDFPQVHVLHGDGNLWWSGAINVGSKYAIEILNAEYILLWNDDIYMHDAYFKNLADLLRDDDLNNIYGSYIYEYPNETKLWATGGYFNNIVGIRKTHRNTRNDYNNQWFTGMGTVIPSTIVKKMNYWDSINFPQYHGDIDFTLRAFESGVKLISRPDLVIWNKVEFSSFIAKKTWTDYIKSLKIIQSRYNIKKEALFLRKHTLTPLWIIYFSFRQAKYLISFLKNRYSKPAV